MPGSLSPDSISTRLQRIAQLASEAPPRVLTTLHHHIDLAWLQEAYRRTRKDGAVGVDGQTAEEYAANLESNLQLLLDRFKSGRYFAPPVRRVHLPKENGKTRPIGIPTFEDKILQRAVAMVLEAVYEEDFRDCSYGFRPGRSAHQALAKLWRCLMNWGGAWVIELDIESFFDTLDHQHLRSFLDQRVRDGVLRRTMNKWLKAGVLEEGAVHRPKGGTPQGGVISPLLANVYLHEVLDRWFEDEVRPRLAEPAFLLRYADDAILCFRSEKDARRVLAVLSKRFARFGLRLHPEKTRLVQFREPASPAKGDPSGREEGPGTFDLLGFTHHWARSRRGRWYIQRETAKSRLRRSVQRIDRWCREHRHDPIRWQHERLARKIRGHMNYFGLTGNGRQIGRFWHLVRRTWHKWLARRGGRKPLTWARYVQLLQRFPLPPKRIVHSVYRRAASA